MCVCVCVCVCLFFGILHDEDTIRGSEWSECFIKRAMGDTLNAQPQHNPASTTILKLPIY